MTTDEVERQKLDVSKRFYVDRAGDSNCLCWVMVDRQSGQEVGSDGGEPEDALLIRDLVWVVDHANTLAVEIERLKAEVARLTELLRHQEVVENGLHALVAQQGRALAAGPAALRAFGFDGYAEAARDVEAAQEAAMKEGT